MRRGLAIVVALSAAFALFAGVADAGTLYLKSCSGFGDNASETQFGGSLVWGSSGGGDYSLVNRCSLGGSFQIVADKGPANGATAGWSTVTPPAIGITGVVTPPSEVLVNPELKTLRYEASYFWDGGTQSITAGASCCSGMDYGSEILKSNLDGSRYFGFQVTCKDPVAGEVGRQPNVCALPSDSELVDVRGVELVAEDSTLPSLAPQLGADLWSESSRWVRGSWPLGFSVSDESGVCAASMTVAGEQAAQEQPETPDQRSWTQCTTPVSLSTSVNTSVYPNGAMTLGMSATDAAQNPASASESVEVDNAPVELSLTGPRDALVSSGTQYVNATASAGPSGVSGISCSVDGGPAQLYPGASAAIPVSGLGSHAVDCTALNNAVDSTGTTANSATQDWSMTIRQATVSAVSFSELADAMHCDRVRERVRVPGRWVIKVHNRHELLRIYVRAHWNERVKVTSCHARVENHRISVWVTVVHHGDEVRVRRTRTVRVVVLPHRVSATTERIGHGEASVVSGWVGTTAGQGVSGIRVRVLAAPDNGLGHFSVLRTLTTANSGFWSATLPAGPSRLVEAQYAGSSTLEPAASAQLIQSVPASVDLAIRPKHVRWGQTIRISGRIAGGYIPGARQQLLRLRIGADGVHETVGIPDVSPNGRFHTTWTFASGQGVVHYWFTVSTLNEADYPFTPASSEAIGVTVGH